MPNEFDALSAAAVAATQAEGGVGDPVQPETEVEQPVDGEVVEQTQEPQEPQEPVINPVEGEGDGGGEPQEPEVPELTFGNNDPAEPVQTVEEIQELLSVALKDLEKAKQSSTEVFANEQMRAMNEYVKNGGVINKEFLELQEKDYTNVDFNKSDALLSVLMDKYKFEGFSQAESQRLAEKNFGAVLNPDEYDDEEVMDAKMDLKLAVKQALPQLQERKEKVMMPASDPKAVQKQQENINRYKAEATVAVNGINSFTLNLSDDFPIKANIDAESKRQISNLVVNPENQATYFADNYLSDDGKIDFESFARDEYIRLHFDSLMRAAFDQGKSVGSKTTVRTEMQQENPDISRKRASAPAGSEDWKAGMKAALSRLS